ncbi:hypothetical protein [Burkholderia territorii]|uniref:hypothetical protein n=1 Tax=Burkholderia territorii TaxID=1503055 RepID=UPI0012DA1508|nr:hypothetical protein [Burkholderia territorii]
MRIKAGAKHRVCGGVHAQSQAKPFKLLGLPGRDALDGRLLDCERDSLSFRSLHIQ